MFEFEKLKRNCLTGQIRAALQDRSSILQLSTSTIQLDLWTNKNWSIFMFCFVVASCTSLHRLHFASCHWWVTSQLFSIIQSILWAFTLQFTAYSLGSHCFSVCDHDFGFMLWFLPNFWLFVPFYACLLYSPHTQNRFQLNIRNLNWIYQGKA